MRDEEKKLSEYMDRREKQFLKFRDEFLSTMRKGEEAVANFGGHHVTIKNEAFRTIIHMAQEDGDFTLDKEKREELLDYLIELVYSLTVAMQAMQQYEQALLLMQFSGETERPN